MIVLHYSIRGARHVRATPILNLRGQALCRWLMVGRRRPGEIIGVGNVADRHGRSGTMRIGYALLQPSLDAGRGRGTDSLLRQKIPWQQNSVFRAEQGFFCNTLMMRREKDAPAVKTAANQNSKISLFISLLSGNAAFGLR